MSFASPVASASKIDAKEVWPEISASVPKVSISAGSTSAPYNASRLAPIPSNELPVSIAARISAPRPRASR